MIKHLIESTHSIRGCTVLPPDGAPIVRPGLVMPEDLKTFYERCGGLRLFVGALHPFEIVGPDEFEPSNLAILGLGPQQDQSDDWYFLARSGADQFISIDLSPARAGRCYDSFWDRHAVAGSSTIIAMNFSDCLQNVIASAGRNLYWLEAGFKDLGDAYG